ncbi:MAG TPA: NAD-dependent epimerase/dehydratase family protein [Vicinamibacterales bacterium]|nr:NAD-dependent epimerase/dehydratase family protein [Vicinamibacterales bacterium]
MRVLVTGGAGFIGSHTVDQLLLRGYDVRILDSLQPRVHPRGVPPYLDRRAELVIGDVSDASVLRSALEGVAAVIHLAAYQDYMPDFSRFVHTNTESTALLFELVVRDRLPVQKIVCASSQSVAGEGRYTCALHGDVFPGPRSLANLERGEWDLTCPSCGSTMTSALIPESVCTPHTTYAISKYAIELLCDRLGRRYGIPTACMRYTYVQGSRNSFYNAYSGVCRIFALRIRHGLPPVCFEDGQQLRDYVNVADVARANVLALERDEANGAVLNVGGGRAITVEQFARLMLRAAGSDLPVEIPGEFRLGDTRHTVSDISAMRALGWEPTVPVERNIDEYLAWFDQFTGTEAYLAEAERVMTEQGVIRRVWSVQ